MPQVRWHVGVDDLAAQLEAPQVRPRLDAPSSVARDSCLSRVSHLVGDQAGRQRGLNRREARTTGTNRASPRPPRPACTRSTTTRGNSTPPRQAPRRQGAAPPRNDVPAMRCGKRPSRNRRARNWWHWPSACTSTRTAGRCCAACTQSAARNKKQSPRGALTAPLRRWRCAAAGSRRNRAWRTRRRRRPNGCRRSGRSRGGPARCGPGPRRRCSARRGAAR